MKLSINNLIRAICLFTLISICLLACTTTMPFQNVVYNLSGVNNAIVQTAKEVKKRCITGAISTKECNELQKLYGEIRDIDNQVIEAIKANDKRVTDLMNTLIIKVGEFIKRAEDLGVI